MKKYLVLNVPYGVLEERAETEQQGVYETREEAVKKSIEFIQDDLNEYGCMVDLMEVVDFANGKTNTIRVNLTTDNDCEDFYKLTIIDLENLKYKG